MGKLFDQQGYIKCPLCGCRDCHIDWTVPQKDANNYSIGFSCEWNEHRFQIDFSEDTGSVTVEASVPEQPITWDMIISDFKLEVSA